MCVFKSAMCFENDIYVPEHDNYGLMCKELNICSLPFDSQPTFVRVNVKLGNGSVTSDPSGWEVIIDQDVLPKWYSPQIHEKLIKDAIYEWFKSHVVSEGHHEVFYGRMLAIGDAVVDAYHNSSVIACGNASVTAHDNVVVTAKERSVVKAYDYSVVRAYDKTEVTSFSGSMVDAFDTSVIFANDYSTVTAYGEATVFAYDEATVTAFCSATVTVSEFAKVVAYGASEIVASRAAIVIIPKNWGTSKPVQLIDDAICINHLDKTVKSATKWTMEE